MEAEKSEKKIKSLGFTLKIKENKKKEVKKNTLFDAKNFRKPFEEDIVYKDDVKIKEELIKEVEGKKIHAVHEEEKKGPLVIPLIKKNEWRNLNDNKENDTDEIKQENNNTKDQILEKEMKEESHSDSSDFKNKYGLQIPVKKRKLNEASEQTIEVTKVETTEPNDNMTIKDNRTLEEIAIDAIKKKSEMKVDNLDHTNSTIEAIPILKQNAVPNTENLKNETEKFRYDIQFRPEESTLEDYERIPIEEFGAAMLRGMGWEKGKAVGRNRGNKDAMVEPIEFIPRPALLGLGAQPKPPDLEDMKKRKKRGMMMGKDEPPKEYKPNITSDGRVKHFKTLDEPRHSERSSSHHRDRDSSRHRRHSSHRSNSDRDKKRSRSRDNYSDHESTSSHTSSAKKETKYTHSHSSSSSYTQSRGSSHHRSHRHSEHSSHRNEEEEAEEDHYHHHQIKPQNTWLYPNIRVRVVSKSYKSGKYYKKKGVVFDIARPGECTLRLDNGKLLEEVKERYLETLIPEINDTILVVKHTTTTDEDYYQKVGKVLSKDRKTETAMIQMESTMTIVNLSFDDICEFKGNSNEFY
ncbi:hypothetical protein BCR36DRAFT_405341 [Piromyces finnis]|uniref:G-patch domain-containing protein n=1 Tax=Piromyces finnis TaxID=1754191 RepID=A0A1Y1V4M3_9FUNG|nr:hypothetical protein BCR36DRAFT_405341 [Piromyces finnis]|eukprot:ORX47256.1 hypothetical protein BCR36DRAFT_405341 [Piromyces finnis]